jgi:hypothetical protein
MPRLRTLIALAAALAATFPAAAARRAPDKLPATRIRDLHYGDVLFYYFQGPEMDLDAITRLEAYEHWGRLPHHEAEAELLLGGLYLDLGLHNEAGERFAKLLTPDVPVGVRNRAWFYLAEVWYARGYLDKAEQALAQVQGKLPGELEAQKQHLLSNALIRQGRYDDAVRLLEGWQGPPDWVAYARFNLGIALIREHRLADADRELTAVGTLETDDPEMLALRDRANLALGYANLQANEAGQARPALERVRLTGPYSDKALLGLGWADSALGDNRSALVPWLELRRRSLADAAVQESYLAVPYAYGKLGANNEAASSYETALASYATESHALDEAIDRVEHGKLLEPLLSARNGTGGGWFWQLKNVPNAPESRYLYTILAGHDFQEGLKNYRDLGEMQRTLAEWSGSMEAFGDMIDARERAYAERLPRVDRLLASGATDRLQQRRDELASRLDRIEREHDVAALGSPDQRAKWAQVRELEAALASAPGSAGEQSQGQTSLATLRDRLRLVKGVLYFQMDEAFRARVWQQRRTIKDLDLALHEAQERWIRVQRARKSVPTNTGEFAARVAALQSRITALQGRLVAVRHDQSEYLTRLAAGELEAQKQRLAAYQVQARFELASMYDRAANQSTKPSAPGTGQPARPADEASRPAGETGAPQPAPPAPQAPAAPEAPR